MKKILNKIYLKSLFANSHDFNFWRIKSNYQRKYEKKVQKAQLKVFNGQLAKVLKKLRTVTSSKSVESQAKKVSLKLKDELKISYKEIYPALLSLYKDSANETFNLLGVDLEMDATQPDVQELLKSDFETMVTNVTETTNKRLEKQVVTGLSKNEGYQEIAKRIAPILNNVKRARVVARTETARYSVNASERAMTESDVVSKKKWQTEPGACPICSSVNGEEVGLNQSFSVAGPPAHPNCRCDILPILGGKPKIPTGDFNVGAKGEEQMKFTRSDTKKIKVLDDKIKKQTKQIASYLEGNSKLTEKQILKITREKIANGKKLFKYNTIDLLPKDVILKRRARYVNYITDTRRVKTAKQLGVDRKIIFTGGIPASGKSSMLKNLDLKNYVVLDSDMFKTMTPEYKRLKFLNKAAMVHEESSKAIRRAFDKAVKNGQNIIFDGTFANISKYDKLIRISRKNGYGTNIYLTDLDPNIAMLRAVKRYNRSGRLPSLEFIAESQGKISAASKRLANKADTFKLYNNAGSESRLIMSQHKGPNGEKIIKYKDKKQSEVFLDNKYNTIFDKL